LGVEPRAAFRRVGARCDQLIPGLERHEGRQIDARVVELRNELRQPRAAFGERHCAQIVAAFSQQIVGAQVRREFAKQLRRYGFAIEPLLQHVERLHAAFAQDQQLAVDGGGQPQRRQQVREAF
jgi:hypothetical protein